MDGPYDILLTQIYFFSSSKGGPLVNWIPTKDRFYLIGIVSGSFFDCSNILPGIFVQVDEISVLNFLRKEIFGDDPIQLGIRGLLYLEGWELFFKFFFYRLFEFSSKNNNQCTNCNFN